MIINIAASHRFHLLDLARELERLGHDVRFYSYVPTRRTSSFGLKKEANICILWAVFPFLILQKVFPRILWITRFRNIFMDYFLVLFMRPCDVYIALGSVYKKSFIVAKNKYNAITILEWGSKHINEQIKMFGNEKYDPKSLKRELTGFQIVDYISIPSNHVKESFLLHNIEEKKLFVNPYGVDISTFYPTKLENEAFDIIFVGGWRYEKGCDLLIRVCEKYGYSLLHVGSIVNLPFPVHRNMLHIDSVNQKELVHYYSKAKIFILPSRAEGLAMVQVQAIACGLPIVCSQHTGGSDLRQFLNDKKWIIEMEEYTVEALNNCIQKALVLSAEQVGKRAYADSLYDLTWAAYGKRYNCNLMKVSEFH